ncbi:putative ubiquinol-cytochrome c reductase hinge protein, partial [Toxoplasma gondii ARI]
VAKDIFKYLK